MNAYMDPSRLWRNENSPSSAEELGNKIQINFDTKIAKVMHTTYNILNFMHMKVVPNLKITIPELYPKIIEENSMKNMLWIKLKK